MKFRHKIDLILGGIVLAVLLTTLSTAGNTQFASRAVSATPFPADLCLTAVPPLTDPSPEVYKTLGKMGRVVVGQYTVNPNDTLGRLAKLYGSTSDSLRSTNRLETTSLAPGKTIIVHNGTGMLHQVREEKGRTESLQRIAGRYNQAVKKIVVANRLPGVALLSSSWLTPGHLLFIPNARLRFSDYDLPVAYASGKRFISSGFGPRRHPVYRTRSFHTGWDMPRPYGFPVKATREGIVIFAGWRGAYGRLVIIKHPNGLRTWYGHLAEINTTEGKRVKKGEFIGRVGSSGNTTGPHLHFEVRDRYGKSLNPRKFLF